MSPSIAPDASVERRLLANRGREAAPSPVTQAKCGLAFGEMTHPSSDSLRERLGGFPRQRLAHLPTPLQPMPRLSKTLGGPALWIKRDDCTGLATGGNKTRKLEFLMGAAQAEGADGVITFGALQSNHARQTAAAAARLGLNCDLILITGMDYCERSWLESGNRLLDELLGARLHLVDDEAAAARRLAQLLDSAQDTDRIRPYIIPTGGSNWTGALGYVDCALELRDQLHEQAARVDTLVHATASMGTQTGLAVGMNLVAPQISVRGVNVYAADVATQRNELRSRCDELAEQLGVAAPAEDKLIIEEGFRGPGYGVPTEAMLEAVELVARLEGILLDPVYTGKAMAGLIEAARRGRLSDRGEVVFLHTGGVPGLFAYRDALAGKSSD